MAENVLRRLAQTVYALAANGGRAEADLTGLAGNHIGIRAISVKSKLSLSTLRYKLYGNDTKDGTAYTSNSLLAEGTIAATEAEPSNLSYIGYARFDEPGILYMDLDGTSELHVAWENEDASDQGDFQVSWLYQVMPGVRDLTPSTDTGPSTV